MKNLHHWISSLYHECWPPPVLPLLSETLCLISLFPITLIPHHFIYFLTRYLLTLFKLVPQLCSCLELVLPFIFPFLRNIWVNSFLVFIWGIKIPRNPFISCRRMNNSKCGWVNLKILVAFLSWNNFRFFIHARDYLARLCVLLSRNITLSTKTLPFWYMILFNMPFLRYFIQIFLVCRKQIINSTSLTILFISFYRLWALLLCSEIIRRDNTFLIILDWHFFIRQNFLCKHLWLTKLVIMTIFGIIIFIWFGFGGFIINDTLYFIVIGNFRMFFHVAL